MMYYYIFMINCAFLDGVNDRSVDTSDFLMLYKSFVVCYDIL